MPRIRRVVETALYVADVERAIAFYGGVLGLRLMNADERIAAFDAGEGSVLLLFLNGASTNGVAYKGGRIPPHDGSGPVHFAFAIDAADYDAWAQHLEARDVAVESRVGWMRGGKSLYFRDPDGHSVELVTPGTWETY